MILLSQPFRVDVPICTLMKVDGWNGPFVLACTTEGHTSTQHGLELRDISAEYIEFLAHEWKFLWELITRVRDKDARFKLRNQLLDLKVGQEGDDLSKEPLASRARQLLAAFRPVPEVQPTPEPIKAPVPAEVAPPKAGGLLSRLKQMRETT